MSSTSSGSRRGRALARLLLMVVLAGGLIFALAAPTAAATVSINGQVVCGGDPVSWLQTRPPLLRGALVGMVEATQHRHGAHRRGKVAQRAGRSLRRRLPDPLVRSLLIEIRDILAE